MNYQLKVAATFGAIAGVVCYLVGGRDTRQALVTAGVVALVVYVVR